MPTTSLASSPTQTVKAVRKGKPQSTVLSTQLLLAYFNTAFSQIADSDTLTPADKQAGLFSLCSGTQPSGYVEGVFDQDTCAALLSKLYKQHSQCQYNANIGGRASLVTVREFALPQGYKAWTDYVQMKSLPQHLLDLVVTHRPKNGGSLWYHAIANCLPLPTQTITIASAQDVVGEWFIGWHPGRTHVRQDQGSVSDNGWIGHMWVELKQPDNSKMEMLCPNHEVIEAVVVAEEPVAPKAADQAGLVKLEIPAAVEEVSSS